MLENEENTNIERRLRSLEDAVHTIRSELADIRAIVSSGYDALFEANDNRSQAIQRIARHIEQIEDRLEPAFSLLFPQHAGFLDEAQAVFDANRKR